jgi:DNA polymerase-3 subunit delta'
LSGNREDAGLLPAFMEYGPLGARYERLIGQFRAGRQVHAYLFAGPQGIGKRTYARTLSSVLFCESADKPCGKCGQCRLIREGKNTSVIEISPEDNKAVPVDRIREIISMASMHSLDGRERAIIIEPMESLTPQAQNCLLKSLEDPNTNVIYFLLSHDPSSLPDTIVSRCFVFKLTPWPDEILTRHLLRLGYPQNTVERAVILSGGNVGEALSILDEKPDSNRQEALEHILRVSDARGAARCSAMLKDMAGSADQILFLLERYLQQCMLAKSGLISPALLRKTPWSAAVQNASLEDLADLTEQVFRARKLKMSNVNWQSNMDQLILKLLEATNKWQRS